MSYMLTVYDMAMTPIAQGRNQVGEVWRDTLLRLYQSTLPADSPRRKVVLLMYGERGANSIAVTGYDQETGRAASDPPIMFQIDPPQF